MGRAVPDPTPSPRNVPKPPPRNRRLPPAPPQNVSRRMPPAPVPRARPAGVRGSAPQRNDNPRPTVDSCLFGLVLLPFFAIWVAAKGVWARVR